MKLDLDYRDWDDEEPDQELRFSPAYYLCILLLLTLFAYLLFRLVG